METDDHLPLIVIIHWYMEEKNVHLFLEKDISPPPPKNSGQKYNYIPGLSFFLFHHFYWRWILGKERL